MFENNQAITPGNYPYIVAGKNDVTSGEYFDPKPIIRSSDSPNSASISA